MLCSDCISTPLYSLGSPVHLCTTFCSLQAHNHRDRYSGKSCLPQLTKGGHIAFPLMSRGGGGGGGGRWTQEQVCMKEKEVKSGGIRPTKYLFTFHLLAVLPDAAAGMEYRPVGSCVPVYRQLCNSSTQLL